MWKKTSSEKICEKCNKTFEVKYKLISHIEMNLQLQRIYQKPGQDVNLALKRLKSKKHKKTIEESDVIYTIFKT